MKLNFKDQAAYLGLEEEEFQEMIDLFVETCSSDLERLTSAIEKRSFQEVIEASHSIKGASGNLGFVDMYDVAKRVESNARNDILEGAMEAVGELQEKLTQIMAA